MHYLLTLLLVFTSSFSYAGKNEYVIEKKAVKSFLEIKVDSVTSLGLPQDLMMHSKIVGADGITVITENFGMFSVASMTSKDIGFPDFDMRSWPLYILGDGPKNAPSELLREIKKIKKVLYESNNLITKGVFNSKQGLGYVLIGKEKSTIYLTDSDQKDIITVITTTNMKEKYIKDLLLQGVI